MARHTALNFADHAKLKVRRERAAELGDAVMSCPVFPAEFRKAQAHYPILFAKTGPGGAYAAGALFGLEQGENLFLNADGWDASYVPMAMRIAPFLIGFSSPEQARAGGPAQVHVDLEHPRVSYSEGEPVFLEGGASGPVLEEATEMLAKVHHGASAMNVFSHLLTEFDLLEPMVLGVTLADQSENRLVGFFTVNEQKLSSLSGADLDRLNQAGLLASLFMAVASLGRIEALAARKNARRAAQAR